MIFANGESVVVLTAGTVLDPYSGDATSAWDLPDGATWTTEPTEVDELGVGVEPRPSGEPVQEARNAVVSGYTLYFPPTALVTAANRVVVRGGTYDVQGDAAVWVNPFTGWEPGTVVQVERTQG